MSMLIIILLCLRMFDIARNSIPKNVLTIQIVVTKVAAFEPGRHTLNSAGLDSSSDLIRRVDVSVLALNRCSHDHYTPHILNVLSS